MIMSELPLREKCPNTEVISGPYFPVFGLKMEIYSVNLVLSGNTGKYELE